MTPSKRSEVPSHPAGGVTYLSSPDGIPSPGQIMELLLTSLCLALPWRAVPFDEQAVRGGFEEPKDGGIYRILGGFQHG